MHNLENYMAASAALAGEVPREAMSQTARSFTGVEHRLELVRTHNGVRYYNDSIASSPTRTAAGLRSFDQKVILIAGGYDKHIPFDELSRVYAKKSGPSCCAAPRLRLYKRLWRKREPILASSRGL